MKRGRQTAAAVTLAVAASLRVSVTVRPGMAYRPVMNSRVPVAGAVVVTVRAMAGVADAMAGAKLPWWAAVALWRRLM